MNDISKPESNDQRTWPEQELKLSSSASSASLFSTFSRPMSTMTSGARRTGAGESYSVQENEDVLADLYTSIQLNADFDEEAEQPPLLKVHSFSMLICITRLKFLPTDTTSQVSEARSSVDDQPGKRGSDVEGRNSS